VCFDKTGTLTTTSIEVFGYQAVDGPDDSRVLLNPVLAGQVEDKSSIMYKLFGTCHGVAEIEGELLGDCIILSVYNSVGYRNVQFFWVHHPSKLKSSSEIECKGP